MTEEEIVRRCVELVWDFGEIYDGSDVEKGYKIVQVVPTVQSGFTIGYTIIYEDAQ